MADAAGHPPRPARRAPSMAFLSHPLGTFIAMAQRGGPVDGASIISCDECVMQHTSACDDCVVAFICKHQPEDAVVIDVADARAVKLLGDAGLVPRLRQVRRTG